MFQKQEKIARNLLQVPGKYAMMFYPATPRPFTLPTHSSTRQCRRQGEPIQKGFCIMSPAFRGAITLALLGLAAGSQSAQAQVTQDYSTNIVDPFYTNVASFTTTTSAASPTFDRPALGLGGVTPAPPTRSGLGNAVGYAAQDFTTTSDGIYRVTTTINSGYADPATSATGTDNFVQALYKPTASGSGFNPALSTANAVLAYSQVASGDSYQVGLSGSTAYTLVNAGYYNSTLTGPQLSVGSATTAVDLYHAGTTMNVPLTAYLPGGSVPAPSPTTQTLTLAGGGAINSFNSFTIAGLQDDFAGSLTAQLTHDGVTVSLFDQPDKGNFGSFAAFDPSQTYTFTDTGADLPATMEATAIDPNNPNGPYPLTGGAYKSLGRLAAFNGDTLAGDWTLSLLHGTNGSSVSSFLGFTFNTSSTEAATPVPEASTWVGFGLGGFVLTLLAAKRRRTASALS